MDKIAKKAKKKLMEIGPVAALDIKRKRQRDPDDMLSAGKRSTQRKAAVGFETKNDRDKADLNVRGETNRGRLGGGATRAIVKRRLGIVAGTQIKGGDKLMERITPKVDVSPKGIQRSKATEKANAADIKTMHSKKPFELMDLVPDAIRGRDNNWQPKRTAKEKIHSREVAGAKKRIAARDDNTSEREFVAGGGQTRTQRESPIKTRVALGKVKHNKIVALAKKKADREVVAASTELDWTNKLVEHLIVEKDWIKGAVNPAHKGFCSPMTKSTCTPRRKALAKRFKKAGRKEKKTGGTGWEGKV